MTRKREDISAALDTALSGVYRDPTLFNRIVNQSKGDAPPVKRKLTVSMAFVLILALITCTVAIAAVYRGVSYFMFEMYGEQAALDEDYLISGMEQSHSNPLVSISVVDAYWDGVQLSIAFQVSSSVPGQIIRVDSDCPEHDHYRPVEEADILMHSPDPRYVMITNDENGEITRPHQCGGNWIYEDDDSLTFFLSLPLNSMSERAIVSIPFSFTLTVTGEVFDSVLYYQLPVLNNPVAEHEHVWLPASCVTPKICAHCGRSEGELDAHRYQLSQDGSCFVCMVCAVEMSRFPMTNPTFTLAPGDGSNIVLTLQHRLSELGYYYGVLHGKYDDATTQAIKAYQEDNGLVADGICGHETLRKLFP